MTGDRSEQAAAIPRRLEAGGVSLGGILNGEAGRRWVREDCKGDLEVARAAFELRHPGSRVLQLPESEF